MNHLIRTTLILLLCSLTSFAASEPQAILPKKHLAFLNNYCISCHDSDTEKGEVNLEDLPLQIKTIQQAELWQDVLNAINSGEMPPEKKKQPKDQEKVDFLDDLSNTMVTARRILSDSGGKITMRRLNKREYKNSLIDLLGVELEDEILPKDGGTNDFDTVGASLFISSDKFNQYLELGRKALDEFYDTKKAQKSKPFVYRVQAEELIFPELNNRKKSEKSYQQFLKLKAEVDQTLSLPKYQKFMDGLNKKQKTLNSLYRLLMKLDGLPDAKKYGFENLAKAAKFAKNYMDTYKYFDHYTKLPKRDDGLYLMLNFGATAITFEPKQEMPVGTYTLRIRAGVTKNAPAFRHFLEVGHPGPIIRRGQLDGFPIKALHIQGSPSAPKTIETTLEIHPDTPRLFTIRERQPTSWHSLRRIFHQKRRENGYGHEPATWVDWVEIEGPLAKKNPSKLSLILDKYKHIKGSDVQKARLIIQSFAKEAFRSKQAQPKFIESLISIFKNRLAIEKDFSKAIRTPLSIILASPRFIFMPEPGEEKKPRPLTDLELAIRLSYFLWSSPPDSQLIELANKNQLRKSNHLRKQVDRMIQDPKAHHFVSGISHQWLDMKRLDFFQFDGRKHREFDENMRSSAREEVYQSILHLLQAKEQGQLDKLLKSNYVIINSMLATHYGIKNIKGDHFRKVNLSPGSPRGGLLGMSAIHAMGSDGIESSPVERGAWVLRHLLNDPPPPAPANVPQLSRLPNKKISKRQRLILHQEEPQCASCHRKIDPIGFGLENFDATGKWRTADRHEITKRNRKGLIDVSGSFYKGPSFKNFDEFRDKIVDRKDAFARSFTEALIEYALGRPFAFTDENLALKIIVSAKNNKNRLDQYIHTLVSTKEFQSK